MPGHEVVSGGTSWVFWDLAITGEINSDGNSRFEICWLVALQGTLDCFAN